MVAARDGRDRRAAATDGRGGRFASDGQRESRRHGSGGRKESRPDPGSGSNRAVAATDGRDGSVQPGTAAAAGSPRKKARVPPPGIGRQTETQDPGNGSSRAMAARDGRDRGAEARDGRGDGFASGGQHGYRRHGSVGNRTRKAQGTGPTGRWRPGTVAKEALRPGTAVATGSPQANGHAGPRERVQPGGGGQGWSRQRRSGQGWPWRPASWTLRERASSRLNRLRANQPKELAIADGGRERARRSAEAGNGHGAMVTSIVRECVRVPRPQPYHPAQRKGLSVAVTRGRCFNRVPAYAGCG